MWVGWGGQREREREKETERERGRERGKEGKRSDHKDAPNNFKRLYTTII